MGIERSDLERVRAEIQRVIQLLNELRNEIRDMRAKMENDES